MSKLFTQAEVQRYLREEVADAGGANKWLRKNKMMGENHILHMVENGDAATLPRFLAILKFRQVTRYEPERAPMTESNTPAMGSNIIERVRDVLLDAHMKHRDPIEALAAASLLRAEGSETPIASLSSVAGSEEK